MKDSCISRLTITETGYQAIQYKNIIDTLPVLSVDKNYRCINDVLCTGANLVKDDFTPPYQDSDLWSNTCDVESKTIDRLVVPLGNNKRLSIIKLEQKSHVFNANLQKQLLSDFKQKSKIKSEECSKFVADKKALITIIFGQCDKAKKI